MLRDSRRAQAARRLEGAGTHADPSGGRAGRLRGRSQATFACRQCAAAHPDRARRGAGGGLAGRGGQAVPADRGALVWPQTGLGRAPTQARPRARPRGMRGARHRRDRPCACGGVGHFGARIPGRRTCGHRGPPASRPARPRAGRRVSDRGRHLTQAPPRRSGRPTRAACTAAHRLDQDRGTRRNPRPLPAHPARNRRFHFAVRSRAARTAPARVPPPRRARRSRPNRGGPRRSDTTPTSHQQKGPP